MTHLGAPTSPRRLLKPASPSADRARVELSVGNPVRLVVLVGIAGVLGAVFLFVQPLQPAEETTAPVPVATPEPVEAVKPQAAKAAAKKTAPTNARPTPKQDARPRPKQDIKATASPKPARKPVLPSPVAPNGLPRAVAAALLRNPVVVVSVVAPGSRVDELALAEARAGAALAGAGFVRLNAYRQAEIAPLAAKTPLRTNPAVLVLRRPAYVTLSILGFADRDSVAQAAANARL